MRGKEEKNPRSYLLQYRQDIGSSCIKSNNILCDSEFDLLIIVPIYNVEKYLDDCLKSIIGQQTRYKFRVIAVNDGCTDGSYEILKSYQSLPNFRIINKENGGVSSARNAALKNIDANYVMFVDSDDILAKGAIERLMSFAYNTNVDIVQGGYDTFGQNVKRTNYTQNERFYKPQRLYGFAWGKVYKKNCGEIFGFQKKIYTKTH